jgi:hypothetical protein
MGTIYSVYIGVYISVDTSNKPELPYGSWLERFGDESLFQLQRDEDHGNRMLLGANRECEVCRDIDPRVDYPLVEDMSYLGAEEELEVFRIQFNEEIASLVEYFGVGTVKLCWGIVVDAG